MTLPDSDDTRFHAIQDDQSLAAFLDAVDHFHDAQIHEAALVSRGYVDDTFSMFGYGAPFNGVLVIQTQDASHPVVEIRCVGISSFRLSPQFDLDADGDVMPDGIVLYLVGRDLQAECILKAEKVWYRILGRQYLGPQRHIAPAFLPE